MSGESSQVGFVTMGQSGAGAQAREIGFVAVLTVPRRSGSSPLLAELREVRARLDRLEPFLSRRARERES